MERSTLLKKSLGPVCLTFGAVVYCHVPGLDTVVVVVVVGVCDRGTPLNVTCVFVDRLTWEEVGWDGLEFRVRGIKFPVLGRGAVVLNVEDPPGTGALSTSFHDRLAWSCRRN